MARDFFRNLFTVPTLRIIIPVVLTVILFISTFYLIALPHLENQLFLAKYNLTRELTNVVWELLDHYNSRVQSGELTLEEAQERVKQRIRSIRYGPEELDYFWINDLHPRMIMHPYRSDLDGHDLSDYQDSHGNYVFVRFVELVTAQDSGFINYMWQWKDDPTRIEPKVSFIRLYEPWGWIIGTGVYTDDIEDAIHRITWNVNKAFIAILAIILIMSIFIVFQGIANEKTRAEAVQKLARSEVKYRSLFQESTDGIYIRTKEGLLLDVNLAFSNMMGYSKEELLGSNVCELYADEKEFPDVQEMIESEQGLLNHELQLLTKDGTLIDVLVSISAKQSEDNETIYQGFVRDMTHLKRLEEQFHQAQKMEAVGRLAGGVAHDFNNLLTAIVGRTELLLLESGHDEETRNDLDEILQTSYRAADLTRQLLAFSRRQIITPRIIDLNDTLDKMVRMLQRIIGEHIELTIVKHEDLWKIKSDPSQIEQVIVNLAVNARDAMPDGGILTIETANIELDITSARDNLDLNPGQYVIIAVSDTGSGIEEELLDKIFEPFFTTKKEGKGTGLGLSTVFGIIKQNNGDIVVNSRPDGGTTFTVYLPYSEGIPSSSDFITIPNGSMSGTETILVVEDEERVRKFASDSLRQYGYFVIEAENGPHALEIVSTIEEKVDIIISDVIMPGMNGVDLVKQLQQKWPNAKVLFMSGYTDDVLSDNPGLQTQYPFLSKPFGPVALLQKVRELLVNND